MGDRFGRLRPDPFPRRTLRTSCVIDPPEPLDIYSATLGVIFVHPTDGLPDRVTLTWDLSTTGFEGPDAATDEAGPLPIFLVPDDNVLVWKNFLKNPTLPTLLDGGATPPVSACGLAGSGSAAILSVGTLIGDRSSVVRSRGGRVPSARAVVDSPS